MSRGDLDIDAVKRMLACVSGGPWSLPYEDGTIARPFDAQDREEALDRDPDSEPNDIDDVLVAGCVEEDDRATVPRRVDAEFIVWARNGGVEDLLDLVIAPRTQFLVTCPETHDEYPISLPAGIRGQMPCPHCEGTHYVSDTSANVRPTLSNPVNVRPSSEILDFGDALLVRAAVMGVISIDESQRCALLLIGGSRQVVSKPYAEAVAMLLNGRACG